MGAKAAEPPDFVLVLWPRIREAYLQFMVSVATMLRERP